MKRLLFLLFCVYICSCASNVEEELSIDICEPERASFSTDILPIITNRCTSCHGGSNPEYGLNYETHEGILVSVISGKPESSDIYRTIKHELGSGMPKNQEKLSDCDIEKIRNWILNGAKND